MQITRIDIVSIPVTDQQRAKRFYTEMLGFALLRESPMWPEADWIQVGPAGAQTSFTLVNWLDSMPAGSISGIVLETPDVDADYAELTARGVACTPIESQPWGRWTTVKDPDGNEFVIQTSAAS